MKSKKTKLRPRQDDYYLTLATAVSDRANCLGRKVGAILVLGNRIISTGYNGTPEDMPNCDEEGCYRCKEREKFQSGQHLDICICVHAEQNALLSAARFGIPVEGAELYVTHKPCFTCAKELLQAKVKAIHYLKSDPPVLKRKPKLGDYRKHLQELATQYGKIENRILITQHVSATRKVASLKGKPATAKSRQLKAVAAARRSRSTTAAKTRTIRRRASATRSR